MDSPQQALCTCMIQYDNELSNHDYLTIHWSINLCLIASFYAKIDRYCRHRHYDFVILHIDPPPPPSGLKTVLLRLILIFRKEISKMKLPINAYKMMQSKQKTSFTAFIKIDKLYCMRFFFFLSGTL